ncbi:MAG: type IV secretion system DNA-binding domain-containing protein [Candidatus Veblenbacteria bacterium]|nr:type IV secretion system DNA-binding domain-containing protein [Candidatus Veblenbacteria bacterium]
MAQLVFWFTILVPLTAVVALAIAVARLVLHRLTALRSSLGMTTLLVLVPRQPMTPEGKPVALDHRTFQEQLGVGEVLWSALGGLHAQGGLLNWLKGRTDHLALEVVAQEGMVSFYLVVSEGLRTFVEQEVHAVYPLAVLQEVADYNVFLPRGVSLGTSLHLSRASAFPLKTYRQLESDPMESMLNALSKVAAPDSAAVQLVVRSAPRRWRRHGVQIASAMQQGKSLRQVDKTDVLGKTLSLLSSFVLPTKTHEQGKRPHEPYRLSPLEEQMVKGIEEKATKAGLEVTCRLVVSARERTAGESYLSNLANAFSPFNVYQYGNRFEFSRPRNLSGFLYNFIHRTFEGRRHFVLNAEELASLYHFPLPTADNPSIRWLTARRAPPPQNLPTTGVLLGVSEYRGARAEVRLSPSDRARHLYLVGKSGTGKSVLLENLAVQDIVNGQGVCVIDPHGDLVDAILARVPKERADDVILFDPADVERPQGLNLLEYDSRYPEQKTFVINEMIKILEKLYDLKQTGGPMFEQYMRNAMLLIMDDPESGSTLMEISKVLADADYRRYKLSRVKDPVVRDFWTKEAQKAGGDASLANMVPYITSKLNQFVANDTMRPIIGQQHSAFNFREIMDTKKILLVRLAKGKVGEINAYLLGLVIVGKLLMAALSRTDVPEYQRQDFFLYIDEFQNFITDSIAVILSEARKYRLNLTVAHQYLGQLVRGGDASIRDAVFGNVGTLVSFRLGVEDAEVLAKEFAPVFSAYDLLNLELFQAYVKLLVNNTPARPFDIRMLPATPGDPAVAALVSQTSRQRYGRNRGEVEAEILARSQRTLAPTPPPLVSPAAT